MIENIPRWVHASVKDCLKSKWTHPLIVEGEDDRKSDVPVYAELRIDGPIVEPFGTFNHKKVTVDINFLVTAQKDQKYVHAFQDLIGVAVKILNECIPVKRIGNAKFSQDTGDFVFTLQLIDDIDVSNFGQVDVTVKAQQASIGATYHGILEINDGLV